MTDNTLLPFAFRAVQGKKITATFDGGRITSNCGVMILAAAERKLDIAGKLAAVISNPRDSSRVVHQPPDILWAGMFAIGCGYEDGTISIGCSSTRRSSSPADGCPIADTICAGSRRCRVGRISDVARDHPPDGVMYRGLLRKRCKPDAVTLDIDETVDVAHRHQQLLLFNAHYDERCFLLIQIYDTAEARPVAVLLRPGKTPSGREMAGHLRRLVRRSGGTGRQRNSWSGTTAMMDVRSYGSLRLCRDHLSGQVLVASHGGESTLGARPW